MTKVGEFDVDENFGKISGLTYEIAFHVDVLKLQDSPDANQWKLMSFNKDGSHPIPKYIHDDTGMQYITINVNSLEPFLKRIKKHNVKLLGDTPVPLGELDQKRIRDAFINEFERRGLKRVGNNGDMEVSLFIVVDQKTSVTAYTNYYGGRYGRGLLPKLSMKTPRREKRASLPAFNH